MPKTITHLPFAYTESFIFFGSAVSEELTDMPHQLLRYLSLCEALITYYDSFWNPKTYLNVLENHRFIWQSVCMTLLPIPNGVILVSDRHCTRFCWTALSCSPLVNTYIPGAGRGALALVDCGLVLHRLGGATARRVVVVGSAAHVFLRSLDTGWRRNLR